MLRVRISVNLEFPMLDINAVRIAGGTKPNDVNTYELTDGTRLKHRYGDGAVALAIKMLLRTKEPQ